MTDPARRRASDARAAIDLVATAGLSLTLAGGAGPARDALLDRLAAARAVLRLPASADPATLADGVDLIASVAAGRAVSRAGLVERLAGRVLVVANAERLDPALAALIAGWLDAGALAGGLVLLDEGEGPLALLADRIAMRVVTDGLSWRDLAETDEAEDAAPADDPVSALCEAAAALGITSLRASLAAHAVASAHAAWRGRAMAHTDAAFAARVVLAPRALTLPPPPPEPEQGEQTEEPDSDAIGEGERLVEAARSALPPGLLATGATARRGASGGKAAARRGAGVRGGPGRVRRDRPGRAGALDLVATLVAAAPMQRLRGRNAGGRLALRGGDLHVRRRKPRARHATIFAVDASGSAALARLGEVKGAVEQLLAESYARRDEVALVAFRGAGAETLLPPTRSLARVRRELADLPGGGATPLAAGIAAGLGQAVASRAAGRAALLVLLTDGGANVARDGGGRAAAFADAEAAARAVAAAGVAALVIDSSPRGSAAVRTLAAAMGARHVELPRLDDASLAAAVAAAR